MTKHEALGTRSRERHDDRRPSMQLACRRSRLALSRHLVIWGARRIDDWIGSVGSDIIQALIAHGNTYDDAVPSLSCPAKRAFLRTPWDPHRREWSNGQSGLGSRRPADRSTPPTWCAESSVRLGRKNVLRLAVDVER